VALTPAGQRWNGDVRLFEHYARLAFTGDLGRTAFLSWYPPLALGPLALPLVAGGGPGYVLAMAAEMAAAATAGWLLLATHAERLGGATRSAAAYAVLMLPMAVVVAWRYDVVPAVVSLAAVVALTSGAWLVAGVALGIAAGLKVYALVLAPLLGVWAWRAGGRRAGVRFAAGLAVVGAAALGLYLLFPGASPTELLAFTASRPVHVESLPGSLIAALASMGVGQAQLGYDAGAFNVSSPAAEAALVLLKVVQPPVLIGVVVLAGVVILRRPASRPRILLVACLAVLLSLVVTNRVISPQYLIWLFPFAALVGGWHRWLLGTAALLTAIVFPWLYSGVISLDPVPMLLILARNLVLLLAWVVSVTTLWRALDDDSTSDSPARIPARSG
jgi:hypothetical protein